MNTDHIKADWAGLRERLTEHSMPEPITGCLLWIRGAHWTGYGQLQFEGRVQYAHRLAWRSYRGEIPPSMHVLHKCDTPRCINPDHLFIGDDAANNRDMDAKGRRVPPRGTHNHHNVLTEAQVRDIRVLLALRVPHTDIAKRYGVSAQAIWSIRHGRAWGWLQ